RAVAHYHAALREDSALALAGLKGAMAAHWRTHEGEPNELLAAALSRIRYLPKRYADFARAFDHYMSGRADSAIAMARVALRQDSTWTEAWMALGAAHYRLLPNVATAESVAWNAYRAALATDSLFTPARYHMAEIALRRGDTVPASALLARAAALEDESRLRETLALIMRCMRRPGDAAQWTHAVTSKAADVVVAGKILHAFGPTFSCSRGAFEAVLASDSSTAAQAWASAVALTALYAALNDTNAVRRVAARAATRQLSNWSLPILVYSATGHLRGAADSVAEQRAATIQELPSAPHLWLLGLWALRSGRGTVLRSLSAESNRRLAAGGTRSDSLIASSLAATALLAQGDSLRALDQLGALRPTATEIPLTWQPWESLAAERILAAELSLKLGRIGRAYELASLVDAPTPVIHLLYARRSLELRRAAAQRGRMRDNERMTIARLAALDRVGTAPRRSDP
ncbi:MAG: hypothetical protein ACREOG_13345, partial [Gemmatimonadaceae bacterium]